MRKLLTRLVFGLWIVGAPMMLIGCGEESKPASPAAASAPAPGGDAAKAK